MLTKYYLISKLFFSGFFFLLIFSYCFYIVLSSKMLLKVIILTLLTMVWRFLFVWEHFFASFCAFFTICYTPHICNLIGSLCVHVSISFRRKCHQQVEESFCSCDVSRRRYVNFPFLEIFLTFFFKMSSIILS